MIKRETNMTSGKPEKLILTFAVPLIISNLGQRFYMIVDSVIVGQGDRQRLKKALAMSLLLPLILGALLSIAGLLTMEPLLTILQTPDDVFIGVFSYLTFLFLGLIAVMEKSIYQPT